MKKILNIILTLLLLIITTKLISCSKKNMIYYKEFIDGIKNKKNFIFMISSKNCIHCQNTINTTIFDLYNKNKYGNKKYNKYLHGDFGTQYSLKIYSIDSKKQEKIKNTNLIITDNIKDYNNIWKEKWAKKISDWIIKQEQNINKINNKIDKTINADSLGLIGTPIYIYIKDGNYLGFETGEIGNLQTGSNSDLWMKYFIKHMILEN